VRQTLFTIPETISFAGFEDVPVFGFGILLFLWVLVCAGIFAYQIKKNGLGAETLGFLPVMILVAVIVGFVLPMVSRAMTGSGHPAGLPIRGYGVMLLLAMVLGCGLAAYRARTMGIDPEVIYSLAFAMFLAGIAGARVFFVIQYWDSFARPTTGETVAALLSVTNGGLVVYGSVIGGLIAAVGMLWYRGIPLLPIADIIAPSMVLGLSLGRIGCLLNGCCYGGVCEPPFPSLQFPAGSPAYVHQQMRGQLRGYHFTANQQGQPVVDRVVADSEAAKAGLKEGDRIANLQMSTTALQMALQNALSLRGAKVRVTTTEGFDGVLTVLASQSEVVVNDLGFNLDRSSGVAMVTQINPDSEAYKAGIRNSDLVSSIKLEEVQTHQQAQDLLAYAAGSYRLVTAGGRTVNFTQKPPPASLPVHPTQIYSAVNAALLAAFLWFLYPFRNRDGEIFATLLCTYPIARILLEMIRTDVEGLGGTTITISQAVSGCFLLIGCGLWIYLATRPLGSVLPVKRAGAASSDAPASTPSTSNA